MKRRIIPIVTTLILSAILIAATVMASATATRDIVDTTLNPGESTGVTVTINPVGETTILLVEEVPAGWVISAASSTGATLPILNAATGEFVFLNIDGSDLGTVVLTYTLTVPLGTSAGAYATVGTVKDGGENILTTVGGDTTITVGGVPSATTATRDIADTTLNAGGSTGVTVTINPVGETTILLVEEVPAGWVISAASSTGATLPILNAATGEFVFLNIDGSDLGTVVLTYTLTVPLGTSAGAYATVGTVKDGGENILTTVGGDTTITVDGVGVYYTLTMAVSPSGSGTTNPSVGMHSYAAGTSVTLTATAASGYDFNYWSGAASGTSSTTSVTMDTDKSAIANFVVETTPPPAETFAWWIYETFIGPFM